MNAPDATKDIIAAIDLLQTEIVTAINSINTSETVSCTIYITTTGNDTTGDGSIGNPYLTFKKAISTVKKIINSGVTITFNFSIGTFTIDAADSTSLILISGQGVIIITGALNLVDSGFTIGAALALDPLTYNVSGGNTAIWTLDQWKYYFLKSGSNYYPITHNALTPTLSVSLPFTGNEIYQVQTTLNIIDIAANIDLTYTQVVLKYTGTIFPGNKVDKEFAFTNVVIDSTSGGMTLRSITPNFTRCHFKDTQMSVGQRGSSLLISGCYYYKNANARLLSISAANFVDFTSNVFENPNTGSTACAIVLGQSFVGSTSINTYPKFVNCNVAFELLENNGANTNFSRDFYKPILVNVNYFLRKISTSIPDNAATKFIVKLSNILGVPVIRWFYDNMTEFVNLLSGRNMQIIGLIYPENEQNLSATLTNNDTTQIIVGNKLQNETISIDYEVKRAGYRQGSFDIINNGTALTQSTDTFITDGTADVSGANVVITVNYNVNEIRIAAQLSNAVAGTLKYNVRRKMITPLTI